MSRRELPFQDVLDTRTAGIEPNEPVTQCGDPESATQSASVWYELNNDLVVPLDLELSTAGSQYETVLQVYSSDGGGGPLEPLACDDGSEYGGPASLAFRAEPGRSYRVKVAGRGDTGGGSLVFSATLEDGRLTSGDLALTAARPGHRVTAGGRAQYSMDIRNLASTAASNVQLSVHPAPDLELIAGETPQGSCEPSGDGDLECSLGSVASGDELVVLIDASPRQSGTTSLSATLDWDTAPTDEGSRTMTLVSDVAPFLVFPASLRNLQGSVPGAPPMDIGTDFVGIAAFNPTREAGQLALEGLDMQGGPVFQLDPAAPLDGRGQMAFTAGDFGSTAAQASMLIARGSGDPLEGFFMSGDIALTRLDGIGGTIEDSKSLYFQIARETADESTRVVLFNATIGEANPVEVKLRDTQGSTVSTRSLAIPAHGAVYDCLGGLLDIPDSFAGGYLQVSSPVPLRGFEFHGTSTYLEAIPARAPTPTDVLWSPHFFMDQERGGTELRLLNLDPGIVKVEASAYGDDGSELGTAAVELASGQLFTEDVGTLFGLSAPDGGPLSGYLRLKLEPVGYLGSYTPRATVMGSVSFAAQGGRARSTLSLIREGSSQVRFLHIAQSSEVRLFTGLALLNPSQDTVATVQIRAADTNGQVTAETTLSIDPGVRQLGLLGDADFFGSSFDQMGGHIEVTSTAPIMAFALFGDLSSEYLAAIESQTE